MPSEVNLARCDVDLRSNDNIVRVHFHGVARQLVAPPAWQALILATRAKGASVHADKRAGGEGLGRKEPRLLESGAGKRALLDLNGRRRDVQPIATSGMRRE